MKKLIVIAFVAALCGCQSTTPGTPTVAQQIKAQLTPNVLAKAAQDTVAAGSTMVLANNSGLLADFVAAADVLHALAIENPTAITGADIQALLATPKLNISAANQKQIAALVTLALGTYQADIALNFPPLNGTTVLFLDAVSNGLYVATGNGTKVVALPVIAVPATTVAPTPTPTPTAAPTS